MAYCHPSRPCRVPDCPQASCVEATIRHFTPPPIKGVATDPAAVWVQAVADMGGLCSAAQKYVAESCSWEAVMFRMLYFSLEFTVARNFPFSFIPEAMKKRLTRPPPGFCLNHCTVCTVTEKLHLRVQLIPSWRLKDEGLCSTFIPLVPVWEGK